MVSKKITTFIAVFSLLFTLVVGNACAFGPSGQGGSSGATVSGKIVESMDSGGYTYVLLEQDYNLTWVAMPVMKVTVGENITVKSDMVMPSFTSKTLKRTFTNLVFSSGPVK